MTGLTSNLTGGATAAASAAPRMSAGGVPIPTPKPPVPSSSGNFWSSLSGGMSMASAAMDIFGGFQQQSLINQNANFQAQSLSLAAKDDLMAAKQEEIRAKQESNDMMDALRKTISSQRLAFVANGIDPDIGTPVAKARTTTEQANLQVSTTRDDAQLRALSRRRQSYERLRQRSGVLIQSASEGSSAVMGGVTSGVSKIAEYSMRGVNRG